MGTSFGFILYLVLAQEARQRFALPARARRGFGLKQKKTRREEGARQL